MITQAKQELLRKRMELLGIQEQDLLEKFVLGSGSGGQKINKTSSCVYLKHIPSGIEVKCQKDRSREMNRFFARRELCDLLEAQSGKVTEKQKKIDKIRKQKKRRERKSLEKKETISTPILPSE